VTAETYLMVDVEADGPVPGRHSMLSLAAVAFRLDRTILGTFECNLDTLPGATTYTSTMRWWQKFPEAWQACRESPEPPALAIPRFLDWVKALPDPPVIFVANPVSYDWVYIHYYLHSFTDYVHSITDASPFYLNALDMRSYAHALMGKPFRYCGKPNYPKAWKEHGLPHTHRAIDDAREHAMTFCAMAETAAELVALRKATKT